MLKESEILTWLKPSSTGTTLANPWLKESMRLRPMALDQLARSLTGFSREESRVLFTALRTVLRTKTSRRDSFKGL